MNSANGYLIACVIWFGSACMSSYFRNIPAAFNAGAAAFYCFLLYMRK